MKYYIKYTDSRSSDDYGEEDLIRDYRVRGQTLHNINDNGEYFEFDVVFEFYAKTDDIAKVFLEEFVNNSEVEYFELEGVDSGLYYDNDNYYSDH